MYLSQVVGRILGVGKLGMVGLAGSRESVCGLASMRG
nr:MAG TPA: hypothetical protein [Caudoviricetes sp.]